MIGVILAAGMAKRLRPLTDTKPKCLLEVGGKTLLRRTVDAMASAGISEFLVVTGYRASMIRDFLGSYGKNPRISYIDNPDYEHNNNIFSLWLAMQELHGQEVLLMDSDILCDPEAVRRVASQECSALAMQRHELGEHGEHDLVSVRRARRSAGDGPQCGRLCRKLAQYRHRRH